MILSGKYFVKTTADGQYTDITTLVDGVRILSVGGMLSKGKAVNIYNEQWVNSQEEDFLIADEDEFGNPLVIRENIDIDVTFIVGQRYASTDIDVCEVHDAFISMLTGSDLWLRSAYTKKEVHCACLGDYAPTTVKLSRGDNSIILGTIKLHTLDAPNTY